MKNYKKSYLCFVMLILLIGILLINNYNKEKTYQDNTIPKLIIGTTNIKPMYFEDETVTISSNVYDLNNLYLYVKDSNDEEIINNITIDKGDIFIEDNNLYISYKSNRLRTYKLIRTKYTNIKEINNTLVLNKEYTYDELINNISITNATFKILKNKTLITEGIIESSMILEIYFNGYVVDSLNISVNSIDISNLTIKEDKYIIENITSVKEFLSKINIDNIVIKDINNNILNSDDNITTSSKIVLDNKEYTFVILGDVTGSGTIFIGDISKLYRQYKNTLELDREFFLAGDVTYDNKISINDIAKLYQYYKGIITSLS